MTYIRLSKFATSSSLLQCGMTLGLVLLTALTGLYAQSQAQVNRTLSLDDLFNLQQVGRGYGGPITFSPDGQKLAFVIQRSKRLARLYAFSLWGSNRSDVYVVPSIGGNPINLTSGLVDDASYWAASWSPDSKRLAMISNKSGNVNVWVWEQASGSLRQVTDRAVDLYSVVDRPFIWISSTHLLVPVLPFGAKPDALDGHLRVAEKANAAWSKAWKGEEATVSILTSGVKPDFDRRPQGELLVIDVNTGTSQVVSGWTARKILVSPDQKAVAFTRKVEAYQHAANKPLPYGNWEGKLELEVFSIDGISLLPRNSATYDLIPTSLRWSPDGEELSFLTYTKNNTTVPQLVSFLRSSRTLRSADTNEIDMFPGGRELPQLEWTKQGWIVLASRRSESIRPRTNVRRDWWLVGSDGSLRPLTQSMRAAPSKLWREANRDSYIGLADGDLWRISTVAPPQNLTATFEKRVSSIVWPQQEWRPGSTETPDPNAAYSHLVVSVPVGEQLELFVVNSVSGRLTAMPKPLPAANVAGFSPASGATLYYLNDRTGLHLWLTRSPSDRPSLIFEANTFLAEVTTGTYRKIEYKSSDGQDLNGWVILPPGYQHSKRYPLLVWVYPGWMAGSLPSPTDDISYAGVFNLQIAAARGYAVLKPSIPFNLEGDIDDPMLKLTAGVLPAVDKAIELGVADPKRIFVMGHSLGGFTVYGLVTQTHRFKAAVAMAGLSNLISGYGEFDIGTRYDDYPHENQASNQAMVIETVLCLNSPPWRDLGRYLRNSPIFYVDRVQTPLMIIHGDLDGVPIEQAEEFFMALHRQGKRAELVRYLGEGHVLESPANIRDMWNRIFAWFETF